MAGAEVDALRVAVVVGELLDNAGAAAWTLGGGLLIVDGLVDQWGVVSAPTDTTVWAEVRFDQ